MKKESATNRDTLRPEYDLSRLQGGVRGKYYRRASAGMNLVLIEPDLAEVFPNSEAVNRALRVLADAAQSVNHRKRRRPRSNSTTGVSTNN
jgi:hypothetical protein